MVLLAVTVPNVLSEESESLKNPDSPQIGIAVDVGEAAKREAIKVKEELEDRAKSLFEREPLGWNLQTAQYLYRSALSIPSRIPQFTHRIIEEGRVLGIVGSLLILLLVMVLLYALLWQARSIEWVERKVQPVSRYIPEDYYPIFLSLIKVLVSALIPLILVSLFSLIDKMIGYRAAWFQLIGRMLLLWACGALISRLLREILTQNLFEVFDKYGKVIFSHARLILICLIIVIAAFWTAEAYNVRTDILELIRFAVSITIAIVVFILFLKKTTFLSILPELPYRGYQWIISLLRNYYYPIFMVSFLAAMFWCFGYKELGKLVLSKIWFTIIALLAIGVVYHGISERLKRWSMKLQKRDETAQLLARSTKTILVYGAVLFTVIVVLNLLIFLMK